MRRAFGPTAAALAMATAASAHHSPAGYDQSTEIVIEGVVSEVAWKNPHIYFALTVPGPDGAEVVQEVQAGSASGVNGLGVSRDVLVVGERVSVRGFPNRRGEGAMIWGLTLTRADGSEYPIDFLSRAAVAAPELAPAEGLSGRWLPQRTAAPYVVEARNRASEAGQAAAQDSEGYRTATASCEPSPPPLFMLFPVIRDIAVGEQAVVISGDWLGVADAERRVRLDLSEHPADLKPSVLGHSIGRFEGETLVIDTVGFAPHPNGVSLALPSGPDKHLVERLTLTEDRLRLRYEITLGDPEHLTGPVTFTQLWDHRPDMSLSGESCDPTVAARFLDEE